MRTLIIATSLIAATASSVASEFRLYYSGDEGITWKRVGKGLPGDVRISSLYTLGSVALAATDAGLYVSNDSARSWTSGPALPNNARPLAFASRNSDLYVGTEHHGVFVSADNARTWNAVTNGLGAKTIRSFAMFFGQLHAGTDRDGIFALDPTTQTWSDASAGLPPNSQILELTRVRGTPFAGLYAKGLYRRTGPGRPWEKVGDKNPLVMASIDLTLAIGLNPGGIYTTDDMGKSFRRWMTPSELDWPLEPPLTPEAPIWAMAATERRLIAGAAGGTYVSNDHGATWRSAEIEPGQTAVAIHTRGRTILAATTTHQVRKP